MSNKSKAQLIIPDDQFKILIDEQERIFITKIEETISMLTSAYFEHHQTFIDSITDNEMMKNYTDDEKAILLKYQTEIKYQYNLSTKYVQKSIEKTQNELLNIHREKVKIINDFHKEIHKIIQQNLSNNIENIESDNNNDDDDVVNDKQQEPSNDIINIENDNNRNVDIIDLVNDEDDNHNIDDIMDDGDNNIDAVNKEDTISNNGSMPFLEDEDGNKHNKNIRKRSKPDYDDNDDDDNNKILSELAPKRKKQKISPNNSDSLQKTVDTALKHSFCLKDKNGELLSLFNFKIKGIEFELVSYPNGQLCSDHNLVGIGIKILHFPNDIEYIDYYQELNCNSLNDNYYIVKKLRRITNPSEYIFAGILCKLSELKDMNLNRIDFNYLIDIKYIKYKNESKKEDYIGSINKLHKKSKFKWNINASLMEKCKKMQQYQSLRSDNFDDNNWFLELRSYWLDDGGSVIFVYLTAASLSLNTRDINIQHTLLIDGVQCEVNKGIISHDGK